MCRRRWKPVLDVQLKYNTAFGLAPHLSFLCLRTPLALCRAAGAATPPDTEHNENVSIPAGMPAENVATRFRRRHSRADLLYGQCWLPELFELLDVLVVLCTCGCDSYICRNASASSHGA